MKNHDEIRGYVEKNAEQYVALLKEACSIPSISAEGQGLEEMSSWLESKLKGLGARVSRLEVPGAPAALLGQIDGLAKRTLMIYDHYDVQPIDPIDLWESQPFEPTERDGRIFARGVADNKGDLIARICALELYKELNGDLPFNLKFFIEGEEESGSGSFDLICEKFADELKADDCVWEGGWFDAAGRPIMYFGCKGLLYVELRCSLLKGDQHSSIAVRVPSAAWDLVRAIASIKDESGRILIDGFYDGIVEPSDVERSLIDALPDNDQAELEILGIDSFIGGLHGNELKYHSLYSPTANIAGFITGYTVPGASKTVLPAEAMAKMDFRLVPDQRADDIASKLRKHLDSKGFGHVEFDVLGRENPSRSPVDSVLGGVVQQVAGDWFPKPVSVQPFMAATGPMYPIAHGLGIPITSPPGVGRPDSQIHAPNENARIDDFLEIVGMTVAYLQAYAKAT